MAELAKGYMITDVDVYGQKVIEVSLAWEIQNTKEPIVSDFTVEALRRTREGKQEQGFRSIIGLTRVDQQLTLQLDPTDSNAGTLYYDEDGFTSRYQVEYRITMGRERPREWLCVDRRNITVDDFQRLTFSMAGAKELPYQLFVPRDYDPAMAYPIILFLHGAGERGSDGYTQLEANEGAVIWARPEEQAKQPCFIVAPQCPRSSRWTQNSAADRQAWGATAALDAAYEVLQNVVEQYNVDRQRVYVTGLSMGGFGTWALGIEHSERIAALVPVCGGGDPHRAEVLRDTPIWAFHHAADPVVPVTMTRNVVRQLEKMGDDLHYRPVLYSEFSAGDPIERGNHYAWVPAYQDEAMRTWLFQQKLDCRIDSVRNISPQRPLPDPPFNDGKVPYGFAQTDHIKRRYIDLRYTSRPDSPKLDVYLPDGAIGTYPVMVYIHGGAFFFGSKEMDDLQPILHGLDRGYAVVSINYSLMDCPIGVKDFQQSVFPQALYQAKAAVRWIRANAEIYGFDPNKIAVLGTSAGGQIAGLLGTTGHKPQTEDVSLGNSSFSSSVQAAIIACGANIATPPELCQAFSTKIEDHARAGGPPLLLLHGTEDETLPYQGSVDLADKLQRVLGKENVQLLTLPEAGHNNDPRFFANGHVDTKTAIFDFTDQVFGI